jgi:hypothetical protein
MKKSILFFYFVFLSNCLAQMPHDAIYMNKKSACVALVYGNNSWVNYWENSLKRDNQNIGRLTTQSTTMMVAFGIKRDLNLIAIVPYIKTNASQGNLLAQQGFQDASLYLKAKTKSFHGITAHGVLGFSMPMTNYVPDFMPMSIGLGTKSMIMRGNLSYNFSKNMYLTSSLAYHARSKVRVDRDSYLSGGKLYHSNDVAVPDAFDATLRMGYMKKDNQIEVFADHFSCIKGDDIRRNDMPFLTNDMTMTSMGIYGKYQPKALGVNARITYVLDGQNIGQSTIYNLGLLYQFKW